MPMNTSATAAAANTLEAILHRHTSREELLPLPLPPLPLLLAASTVFSTDATHVWLLTVGMSHVGPCV